MRLALARMLVWAAEWALRGPEPAAHMGHAMPDTLSEGEAQRRLPPAHPQGMGAIPHTPVGLGAHLQPSQSQAPRARRQGTDARGESPVPDRSVAALRRRLATAERRIDDFAARIARAPAVRPRAEPEWAGEVRARAQRALSLSPPQGLPLRSARSSQPPIETTLPGSCEASTDEPPASGVTRVSSETAKLPASGRPAPISSTEAGPVSTSVPNAAAWSIAVQPPIRAEIKAPRVAARIPERAEAGEAGEGGSIPRGPGYPHREGPREGLRRTEHATALSALPPEQTTHVVRLKGFDVPHQPDAAHGTPPSTGRPSSMRQPERRDAAAAVASDVVERPSPVVTTRRLSRPSSGDDRRRRGQITSAKHAPDLQASGDRSQTRAASPWPLLPDETHWGQPEQSPWPELPQEPPIAELEQAQAIRPGELSRHARLEREQRGELWNA